MIALLISSLLLIQVHTTLSFTISARFAPERIQICDICSLRPNFSLQMSDAPEGWNGEVVSNTSGGKIRGCTVEKVEGTATEWTIQIDGKDADLGKFSDAIYRKYTADAKQQSFQGFRPGTIPPHLLGTYAAFTMDECAREATLEAMQQNNVRPFEDARAEFKIESISIFPPKKRAKKKKGKRKKNTNAAEAGTAIEEEPKWITFETMKEAISAGWKPGQTFSFIARNVKGQKLLDQSVVGAKAIGAGGSSIDLNNMMVDSDDL